MRRLWQALLVGVCFWLTILPNAASAQAPKVNIPTVTFSLPFWPSPITIPNIPVNIINLQDDQTTVASIALAAKKALANTRRGPFELSPYSMQTLLSTGYTLVATGSRFGATSVPTDFGKGFEQYASAVGSLLGSLVSEETYLLQKGSSLYRCQDKNGVPGAVTCWRFTPIHMTNQIDIQNNPLLGTWTGTYSEQGQSFGANMVFAPNRASVTAGGKVVSGDADYLFPSAGSVVVKSTDPRNGFGDLSVSFQDVDTITANIGDNRLPRLVRLQRQVQANSN